MTTRDDIDTRLQRLTAVIVAVGARRGDSLPAAAAYCWACGATPEPDDVWWLVKAHLNRDAHRGGEPCPSPCTSAFFAGLCEPHMHRMRQVHPR